MDLEIKELNQKMKQNEEKLRDWYDEKLAD